MINGQIEVDQFVSARLKLCTNYKIYFIRKGNQIRVIWVQHGTMEWESNIVPNKVLFLKICAKWHGDGGAPIGSSQWASKPIMKYKSKKMQEWYIIKSIQAYNIATTNEHLIGNYQR